VQHPVAVRALGGERPEQPMPMYLTKKERKRIRKTAREEREREKRDKMMMGLIAPAEPKFKLSNFMKVLGDQAIADPSKIELRVLQQMRQRELNHEMRNLSAKLTPAERKAKRLRKLQEDTTRHVHVAVFRVNDLTDPKHRFKVDVNAQQHFMSGTVVLCQQPEDSGSSSSGSGSGSKGGFNLVVVEGGPKGVKKFTKLMLQRIPWNMKVDSDASHEGWADEEDEEGDEDEEEEEEESHGQPAGSASVSGGSTSAGASSSTAAGSNRCQLVWQGILAKRTFTGFKFQECKSLSAARRLMDSRGVVHYWDLAAQLTD
jgi:U4/U6 small nuclear ribonucleoprotein PRP3